VLYVTGDTVWSPEVEEALATHRPTVCVVNAGAAAPGRRHRHHGDRGRPADRRCRARDDTRRRAHGRREHSALSRDELRGALAERGLVGRVLVPEDGEAYDFGG
jgi:hypothetical protein